MVKQRNERNLLFPSKEFRDRVRSAAKQRGFRSEQAFILTACENELKRGDAAEATERPEASVAATLARFAKDLQALFTLAHGQFALTNSLLQYVLTCMVYTYSTIERRLQLNWRGHTKPQKATNRREMRLIASKGHC